MTLIETEALVILKRLEETLKNRNVRSINLSFDEVDYDTLSFNLNIEASKSEKPSLNFVEKSEEDMKNDLASFWKHNQTPEIIYTLKSDMTKDDVKQLAKKLSKTKHSNVTINGGSSRW